MITARFDGGPLHGESKEIEYAIPHVVYASKATYEPVENAWMTDDEWDEHNRRKLTKVTYEPVRMTGEGEFLYRVSSIEMAGVHKWITL